MGDDSEVIPVPEQDVAYLVGRGGATRVRLQRFSGAELNVGKDTVELRGGTVSRELAKLAISIMLQQRQEGTAELDFEGLERRDDVSTFPVPCETVGFLLGTKGATLRLMEGR